MFQIFTPFKFVAFMIWTKRKKSRGVKNVFIHFEKYFNLFYFKDKEMSENMKWCSKMHFIDKK